MTYSGQWNGRKCVTCWLQLKALRVSMHSNTFSSSETVTSNAVYSFWSLFSQLETQKMTQSRASGCLRWTYNSMSGNWTLLYEAIDGLGLLVTAAKLILISALANNLFRIYAMAFISERGSVILFFIFSYFGIKTTLAFLAIYINMFSTHHL